MICAAGWVEIKVAALGLRRGTWRSRVLGRRRSDLGVLSWERVVCDVGASLVLLFVRLRFVGEMLISFVSTIVSRGLGRR